MSANRETVEFWTSANREIMASGVRAEHEAIDKVHKTITPLLICQTLAACGCASMSYRDLREAILPNPSGHMYGAAAAGMEIEIAESRGFIRDSYLCESDGVRLTDAGKHLLMTHATGTTARALINEIEEETAGQA